jgi:parvulin-like peptidyl-prolyl isomerase
MTFRNPAAPRPTRRRRSASDTRRTLLVTISFGLAIVAALAMLVGVLIGGYYADHWAAITTVNGESISKDAVRERAALDKTILDRQLRNYGQLRNMGQVTTDEYNTLVNDISGKEDASTLYSNALDELTREAVLRQYADKNGIKVSDAQLNAEITKEGTVPELRHIIVIAIQAKPTPPAAVATQAEMDAAKKKAETYVADIRSGAAKWDDVFSANDTSYLSNSGDLGLNSRDQLTTMDEPLADAIFALKKDDITDVFLCNDGAYRFAKVTEISPAFVDNDWQSAIDAGSNADRYRAYARAQAVEAAVKQAVLEQYVESPVVQRRVFEIGLSPGYGEGPEVAFRVMIFAPDHSTSLASSLAADDPKWTEAKNRAEAAAAALRADPGKFDAMARDTTINDDTLWASDGGVVPYFSRTVIEGDYASGQGLGLDQLAPELFEQSHNLDDIIGPILQSDQGYVVAEFLGIRQTPEQRIADIQLLLATGKEFTALARQVSETPDAIDGGDMGWVSKYSLDDESVSAIFQTPIGGVSRLVTQNGSGFWLYKVTAEVTAVPDKKLAATLRQKVFNQWLADLTAQANIWKDANGLTAITPTATP